MNLINVPKQVNTPAGIDVTIYVACIDDIVTDPWITMDTAGDALQNLVRTDPASDITFIDPLTQGFATIQALIPNKSGFENVLEGDAGSKTDTNSLSVILKGMSADVLGFKEFVKNREMIVLFKEKCGGDTYLLGEPCSPVQISEGGANTGAAAGDSKETTLTFYTEGSILKIYQGAINLLP